MNYELINRSELLTAISRYSTLTNQAWPMWIEAVINTAPVIDAVPVVRCKDCKHRHSNEFCECKPEDAFCSDGEIKD